MKLGLGPSILCFHPCSLEITIVPVKRLLSTRKNLLQLRAVILLGLGLVLFLAVIKGVANGLLDVRI
jgi:hypothetical protein